MLQISFLGATLSSAFFTVLYVGSLYLWSQKQENEKLDRDHPKVIKRRFISVVFTSVVSILYVYMFWNDLPQENLTFLQSIGMRVNGFIAAATLPLLLTMILFAGPLTLLILEDDFEPIFLPNSLIWWRNFIIGPLSEEVVFRSCMCPLLLAGGYSYGGVAFTSPLFFGLAHLHHIIQHLHKTGTELRTAWIGVFFQLFYTSVFGAYSVFLFLRTGHLIAPFIVHAFCNYMGFPRFDLVPDHPRMKVVVASFILGLVGFVALLYPLTEPTWFANHLFPWTV